MLAEYQREEVAYDGTAELWFDTVQDKDAFFSDPDYLKSVQPDESRFADMAQTVFFVTEEETIFDNTEQLADRQTASCFAPVLP